MAGLGLSANPGSILVAAFLYFSGGWPAVAAMFTAVLAHELGHLTAAAMTGAEVRRVRAGAAGMVIELAGGVDRRREMAIAAAGPIAGILFALACFLPDTAYFHYVGLISLFATAFNLLPVLPLDGGILAFHLLSEAMPVHIAERILRVIGSICGIGVAATGWSLRSPAAAAAGIWMTVLANAPGLR